MFKQKYINTELPVSLSIKKRIIISLCSKNKRKTTQKGGMGKKVVGSYSLPVSKGRTIKFLLLKSLLLP